jgi:ribonucleoside-diphosphate reductase alpha chain
MRAGEHKVARDYVLYREERSKERAAEAAKKTATAPAASGSAIRVKLDDGRSIPLNEERLRRVTSEACAGLAGTDVDVPVVALEQAA